MEDIMQNTHEVVGQDGQALKSPDIFHPGYILKEEIKARKIDEKDFAKLLCILPEELHKVLLGKQSINKSLANRLESLLNVSPKFWLRMQADYDLNQTR